MSGARRKKPFTGSSMKSSRSIYISFPILTFLLPALSSSGLFSASSSSTKSSGQFSRTTLRGRSTAIPRCAVLLSSSLRQCCRSSTSTMLSAFATPISLQNRLMDSGVYPLRLNPQMVGILGSSHPDTIPVVTSSSSFRLLISVYVRLRRANSY